MRTTGLILVIACALILSAIVLILSITMSAHAQLEKGIDQFQASAEVEIVLPDGTSEILSLQGSSVIRRDAPGDADRNGLADQSAEIIQLQLRGISRSLGRITIRAGAGLEQPSVGWIEELQSGTTFPAYSFFDVFARLQASGGPTTGGKPIRAENAEATRMEAIINEFALVGTPYKTFNTVFIADVDKETIEIIAKRIVYILNERQPAPRRSAMKRIITTFGRLKSR